MPNSCKAGSSALRTSQFHYLPFKFRLRILNLWRSKSPPSPSESARPPWVVELNSSPTPIPAFIPAYVPVLSAPHRQGRAQYASARPPGGGRAPRRPKPKRLPRVRHRQHRRGGREHVERLRSRRRRRRRGPGRAGMQRDEYGQT